MGGPNANIEQGTPNIEHRSGMRILNIEQGILNIEWNAEIQGNAKEVSGSGALAPPFSNFENRGAILHP